MKHSPRHKTLEDMEWITGFELPEMVIEERKHLQPRYVLNVLDEKVTDEMGIEQWKWLRIPLPVGRIKYADVVAGVIRGKYTQDDMEAITNNMAAVNAVFMQTLVTEGILEATKYLKESINDDNTKRFKEMQEWRTKAKKVASEVIAYAKEHSMLVES